MALTRSALVAIALGPLFGGALAGCTSSSSIDTAFADLAPTAPPAAHGSDLVPQVAIRNTGTYPNLNREPQSRLQAGDPRTRTALFAQMQALAAARAAGRISTQAYRARLAELQRLAATHSDETLARIEQR
ncbi:MULTISPECIES: hypothetical protein [unclassified Roseitalea]|uniref:hypothetical protein n=1 Tax=unclassified Roseitalea TaxID=2639107 RepID=UPI00273D55B9|nr:MULTISPECIES: hypothetical protein [unclassified Roseitalea]